MFKTRVMFLSATALALGLGLSACGNDTSPAADLQSSTSASPSPDATDSSTAAASVVALPSLSGQARLTLAGNTPTGFDWSTIAAPKSEPLRRTIVTAGTGATVAADSTLTVNYLGAVYGAKSPFDESYTRAPATFPLAGLIPGWQQGLVGLKAGSRVILEVPPALGYGAQAMPGIPANSTLFFVLDILTVN